MQNSDYRFIFRTRLVVGRYDKIKNTIYGGNLGLADKIIEKVKSLPEEKQTEILDFISFLEKKLEEDEIKKWNKFSLESAMRGLETEESLYSFNPG